MAKKEEKKVIKKKEAKEEVAPKKDKLVAPISNEDKEVLEEYLEEKEKSDLSTDVRDSADASEEKPASSEIEKEHKSVKPNVKKNVHGKKYLEAAKLVEKDKEYETNEAIKLIKKTATSKFDSSIEIHINLNVDLTNPDQQIRGSVSLPAGTGISKNVCVVCGPGSEKEAKNAGADTVGGQDVIDKIEKGWASFDVLVATPDMMPALGKIGKILGTKGLMPNPKTGTVTTEVGKVVTDIKKGRVEYKVDKGGILHAPIGKVSFSEKDIKENLDVFMDAIHHSKPASVKGTFIKGVHLSTTMGPGIKLVDK